MSPNRIYLSDIHLDSSSDVRFARFSECLHSEARWADDIFILGDLFEMWIGDDDDSELAERTCAVLRRAAAHARVLSMAGNRDFLCGPGFAARTGAVSIDDPYRTDDGLVLAHGDTLCTGDTAYMALRATLRSSAWQQDMLRRSLDERRRIGAEMRAASAANNANKADNIMDAAPSAVRQLMDDCGAGVLIHGHTHRPGVHALPSATRYVLGNWERCGWILRQQGKRFDLECFSLAVPYRTPVATTRRAP